MKTMIIRFLGLKGSWKWACKQMEKGLIVRPKHASGSVKYKLDHENQRRIVWSFKDVPEKNSDWESANIFLKDFEWVDWVILRTNQND